jgi:bifunctional DNA-binding transcriptional regulator/antitoxin component of YhaV-PrlF toxin-antitoxin module
MPTYEAIVDENGRVELPNALVEKLGIRPGHHVEWFEAGNGEVFFHAIVGTTAGWRGILKSPHRKPPLSDRELKESVGDALMEDDERIRAQAFPTGRDSGRSAAE